MKFSKKLALLSLTGAGLIGIVGCKSVAKMPVNFVAVTSSDYNATVQFGDYDYKFQGKIDQNSKNFTLAGNVVQRHNNAESGGQRMGPPAGGSSTVTFDGFVSDEGEGQQQGGGEGQGGENPFGGGENPFGGGENPFGGEGQGEGEGQGQEQGGENPFGGGENPFGGGDNPFGGQEQGGQQGGGESVAIESIAITLPKSEVFINEAITPTVTFTPSNVAKNDQGIEWSSSDEKVASVTSSGVISPNGEGTVTLTAKSKKDATKTASAQLTVKTENLAQYNWSVGGTYEFQEGYGYVLSFNDEGKTVIHTDFDKTEGRHEFYYNVKINNASSTVKFQAKDPTFKDQLAKDYKKWDERDSTYIFYAKAEGNNNSVATAYMYLHGSDHSVVINSPSGADRALTFGLTWSESGEGVNKKIVVKEGEKEYVADVSVNEQHPGYRLVYGGNAYYLSQNPDVKWKKMVKSDFDGETEYEFTGSYKANMFGDATAVELALAKDGSAKIYNGNPAPSFKGTWSKDATTGKVSVTIEGHTGEFKQALDGTLSITLKISSTGMNMFTQKEETKTYEVAMSQTKPVANAQ